MKKLSFNQFVMVIVSALALMCSVPSCTDSQNESSEDLTVTIVGSYKFELRENGSVTASNIPTQITKVNNNTIQIAISGKETVKATVVKPATGNYLLINVLAQTGITEGDGGDFVNNEINVGFKTGGVKKNYYGIKSN